MGALLRYPPAVWLTAIVIGCVVDALVVPFALGFWFERVPRTIRHLSIAQRMPNVAARASTTSLFVPNWIVACLVAALIGRYIRTLARAWAIGFALGLSYGSWLIFEVMFGFGFWRSLPVRLAIRTYSHLLGYHTATLALSVLIFHLTSRRRRRLSPPGFPVMGPDE